MLTNLAASSRILNEEPFGPVAAIIPFTDTEAAIKQANSLPFGLAAYAFTGSARTAETVSSALEVGMVSINHFGIALPETPIGGVKDSGYGYESSMEGLAAYMVGKFISHLT